MDRLRPLWVISRTEWIMAEEERRMSTEWCEGEVDVDVDVVALVSVEERVGVEPPSAFVLMAVA